MDARQLTLDLWKRDRDLGALAGWLASCGLYSADVAMLRAIADADKSREQESFCCKSLHDWGLAIGKDKNTARRAMERLAETGCVAWEKTDSGFAVLVDWRLVWNLTPRGPVRARLRNEIDTASEGAVRPVVRPGETSPTCSWNQETKTRVACPRVSVDSREDAREPVRPGETARRWLPGKPWSTRDGLTSDDLVRAVRNRDEATLTGLYYAGVEARFWVDCEHHRVTFLACAWQAVTDASRSAMGLLSRMVRHHLGGKAAATDARYALRGEADDWAAATRRAWRRTRAEAESAMAEVTNDVE